MIFDETNLSVNQQVYELPYKGQALSDHLLDLLNKLPTSKDLESLKEEFEKIYGALPEVATKILTTYHEVLQKHGLNAGRLSLYMIGGRLEAKPLKEGSDIDLIIGVEDAIQSADSNFVGLFPEVFSIETQAAGQLKKNLQEQILEGVKKICIDKEISNRFHINNFGAQHDSKIMENIRKSSTSLLIGIYPGKINPQSIKK